MLPIQKVEWFINGTKCNWGKRPLKKQRNSEKRRKKSIVFFCGAEYGENIHYIYISKGYQPVSEQND